METEWLKCHYFAMWLPVDCQRKITIACLVVNDLHVSNCSTRETIPSGAFTLNCLNGTKKVACLMVYGEWVFVLVPVI